LIDRVNLSSDYLIAEVHALDADPPVQAEDQLRDLLARLPTQDTPAHLIANVARTCHVVASLLQ
jgi:hypothetical protein